MISSFLQLFLLLTLQVRLVHVLMFLLKKPFRARQQISCPSLSDGQLRVEDPPKMRDAAVYLRATLAASFPVQMLVVLWPVSSFYASHIVLRLTSAPSRR